MVGKSEQSRMGLAGNCRGWGAAVKKAVSRIRGPLLGSNIGHLKPVDLFATCNDVLIPKQIHSIDFGCLLGRQLTGDLSQSRSKP